MASTRIKPAPANPSDVVTFWRAAGPEHWFSKNADFDTEFRERFYTAHFAAARQELEDWLAAPESALALILLLDQYPRNAFRDTGHMFATDGLALHYAQLSLHHLDHVEPDLRSFICLPYMHAESLAMQETSVELYRKHDPESLYWATMHRDIIARFGRFPHRNLLLGRTSVPEEQAFLDGGGFAG